MTDAWRVVLVEDEPDNRLLFSVLLETRYSVTAYATGRAALEGMRSGRPDVLLLDITLPEMDGPQVLEHIRADEELRALPVIALTAHSGEGVRERFLAMGFDEYVSKSLLDQDALFDAIDRLAGGATRQ